MRATTGWFAVAVILALLGAAGAGTAHAAATPPSPLQFQTDLELVDRLLGAGTTLDVEVETPADIFHMDGTREVRRLTLTTDGSSFGLASRSTYPDRPRFRTAVDEKDRELNYDGEGRLIVWRNRARLALASPDWSAAREDLEAHQVSAEGLTMRSAAPFARLARHDPGDLASVQDWQFALLALGRGYSRFLEEVVAVEPKERSLAVTAVGNFGPGTRGTWTLVVEPAAGYLVRAAHFTAAGRTEPSLVAEAQGVAPKQAAALAGSGYLRFVLGEGASYLYEARLLQARGEADAGLLADLRRRLEEAAAEGLYTLDLRTAADATVPGDDKEPVPEVCCVCQERNFQFAECGHFNPPMHIFPCSSDWCIDNVVDLATCVQTAPAGQNRCAPISVPARPMATQTARTVPGSNCATGGQAVVFGVEYTVFYGCSGCVPNTPGQGLSACRIPACAGGVVITTSSFGAAVDCS